MTVPLTNAQAQAAPLTITFDGKTHTILLLDQAWKAGLERYLESIALDAMAEAEGRVPDAALAAMGGQHVQNKVSNAYQFGGQLCKQFLASIKGMTYLLATRAGMSLAEAQETVKDVRKIKLLGPVLKRMFTDSFPGSDETEGTPDPLSPGPTGPTSAAPSPSITSTPPLSTATG